MSESENINSKLWDDYSTRFNSLSDKMVSAGIKSQELLDVIVAYESLPNKYKNLVGTG